MALDFEDVVAQAFAGRPEEEDPQEEGVSPTSLPAWLQKPSLPPLPWRAITYTTN